MTLAVGFVGLGRIGKPIAANILAAGFDLMVFDVREEPMRELARLGAKRARGLRDLSEHAAIVGVAVVDDSQVEEVVASDGGLLQGGRQDSIIMIHSTIMPGTVRKLAQEGQGKEVKVIDAPVSAELVQMMKARKVFVVSTLSLLEAVSGAPPGETLAPGDARLLSASQQGSLGRANPLVHDGQYDSIVPSWFRVCASLMGCGGARDHAGQTPCVR